MASRTPGQIAKTVAQNFIKAHGRQKFVRLLEMFHNNEPGPKIASEFKVTRQRVHQWKTQLGHERVVFVLHTEIEKLMETVTASRKTV